MRRLLSVLTFPVAHHAALSRFDRRGELGFPSGQSTLITWVLRAGSFCNSPIPGAAAKAQWGAQAKGERQQWDLEMSL